MNRLLIKRKNKSKTLIISVFILTACVLCVKLFFPNNKPVFIFNHAFFTIASSSMEPEYPVNSVVIIKKVPFSDLSAGDVIVYKSYALRGGLALHRVAEITGEGIYTKGDRNDYRDNQLITVESYIGKSVSRITFFVNYLALVRSPAGFAVFFALPCLAAILLYRSVKLLQNAKKARIRT